MVKQVKPLERKEEEKKERVEHELFVTFYNKTKICERET